MDHATAEGLLDSAIGHSAPPPGTEALAAVLSAAALPAACGPVPGEEAVLAAYRVAMAAPVADTSSATGGQRSLVDRARRWRVGRATAAAIAIKAVLAGGIAVGGYALASSAGVLPESWPGVDQPSVTAGAPLGSASGQDRAGASGRAGAGVPVGSPDQRPTMIDSGSGASGPAGTDGSGTTGQADPSAAPADGTPLGLCQAYGNVADRGKALQSQAFSGLVVAAGGAERVEAYCGEVIAAAGHPVKPSQTPKPAQSPKPAKSSTNGSNGNSGSGGSNGNGGSGSGGSDSGNGNGNSGNGNSGNGNSGNGNSGNGNSGNGKSGGSK